MKLLLTTVDSLESGQVISALGKVLLRVKLLGRNCLLTHRVAFNEGLLPCEKLLELLLPPFLKLARVMNSNAMPGSSQIELLAKGIYRIWKEEVAYTFSDQASQAGDLMPAKRDEILAGALVAKFPEVCTLHLL